eukprot:scaffold2.g7452.t1
MHPTWSWPSSCCKKRATCSSFKHWKLWAALRVVNTTRRRWQHWSESLWLRSPCAREPRCRQPIAFSSVWDKYLRTAVDQEWSAAAAGEAIRAALTLHRAANSRPDLQPLSVPALNVASAVMHAAAGKQRRVPAALLPEVAGAGGLAEALAAALGGLCGCGEQDEAADGEYAFLSELAAELLEALLGSKDDAATDAAWGKLAPSMLAACAWEGFKHATTLTPLLENLNRSAELLVDYLGVKTLPAAAGLAMLVFRCRDLAGPCARAMGTGVVKAAVALLKVYVVRAAVRGGLRDSHSSHAMLKALLQPLGMLIDHAFEDGEREGEALEEACSSGGGGGDGGDGEERDWMVAVFREQAGIAALLGALQTMPSFAEMKHYGPSSPRWTAARWLLGCLGSTVFQDGALASDFLTGGAPWNGPREESGIDTILNLVFSKQGKVEPGHAAFMAGALRYAFGVLAALPETCEDGPLEGEERATGWNMDIAEAVNARMSVVELVDMVFDWAPTAAKSQDPFTLHESLLELTRLLVIEAEGQDEELAGNAFGIITVVRAGAADLALRQQGMSRWPAHVQQLPEAPQLLPQLLSLALSAVVECSEALAARAGQEDKYRGEPRHKFQCALWHGVDILASLMGAQELPGGGAAQLCTQGPLVHEWEKAHGALERLLAAEAASAPVPALDTKRAADWAATCRLRQQRMDSAAQAAAVQQAQADAAMAELLAEEEVEKATVVPKSGKAAKRKQKAAAKKAASTEAVAEQQRREAEAAQARREQQAERERQQREAEQAEGLRRLMEQAAAAEVESGQAAQLPGPVSPMPPAAVAPPPASGSQQQRADAPPAAGVGAAGSEERAVLTQSEAAGAAAAGSTVAAAAALPQPPGGSTQARQEGRQGGSPAAREENSQEAELQDLLSHLLPGLIGAPASGSAAPIPATTPPPAGPDPAAGAPPGGAPALAAALACPLTGARLVDPWICGDGCSYERAAIFAWLAERGVSPVTGETVAPGSLRPNLTLRTLLEAM